MVPICLRDMVGPPRRYFTPCKLTRCKLPYTLRCVKYLLRELGNPDADTRGDVAAYGGAQRAGCTHARCSGSCGRLAAGGVRPFRLTGGTYGCDRTLRG